MPRRNASGQFVKKGGGGGTRSTKRRKSSSASRAIVRSTTVKPVIIRERAAAPAKRRHHGGGGGGKHRGRTPLAIKGEIAGWAALLGYVQEQKASTFQQIPTVGKLPRAAIVGGVLHFFGGKHKHVDRAATAALTVAGYEVGKAGFALSGDSTEGWDD